MAELDPGAESFDRCYWESARGKLSVREMLARSVALESHLEGLEKRSLVILEGFDPQTFWCLALAAWRKDLAVLPLAKGQSIGPLPWQRILRSGSQGIEVQANDEAYTHVSDLYILTSGSTGKPKAIGHSLDGLKASARATLDFYGFAPGDSWLLSLDPSHIGGFQILLRTWIGGGRLVHDGDPRALAPVIARCKPRFLSLVPTQIFQLIESPAVVADLRQAKAIMLGGAATQATLLAHLKDLGLPVSITYGSSETASQITGFAPGTFPEDARNVGTVLPVWNISEDGDGLTIQGSPLFRGYFQGGEWHPCAGKYPLPDRGRLQGDSLWIEGRRDQVFQVGGVNVSPAEILAVLESSHNLSDLVILKKPDARFGVLPLLVVRSRTRPDLELIQSCLNQLKPVLRPREIWWYETDEVGKISLSQLERLVYSEQLPLQRMWTYESL